MSEAVLVLNAGSSSLKFAVFGVGDATSDPSPILRGQLAGIGATPRFDACTADGEALVDDPPGLATGVARHEQAITLLLDWLDRRSEDYRIVAVGHRVVHGGSGHAAPALVDAALIVKLAALEPLAPHHQPHNIAAIRAIAARRPELAQVACFDTAFHASQPVLARRLALPKALRDKGLRRYGFHGLSYEYIVGAWPAATGAALPPRLIVMHLGNGASLCAIRDGRSVATTMGFSTADGIPMGTRAGAMDPDVFLYLMREEGMDEAALTDLIYNRSGLLGLSGISSDMATLLESDDRAAREAIELYCYRIAREIGSLAAALDGLDALVFTGGIGEHAAPVRDAVCRRSAWLGVDLDAAANAADGPRISTGASRVAAWVIPTNEELMIARHTRALVGLGEGPA
jgi:acetate kinase